MVIRSAPKARNTTKLQVERRGALVGDAQAVERRHRDGAAMKERPLAQPEASSVRRVGFDVEARRVRRRRNVSQLDRIPRDRARSTRPVNDQRRTGSIDEPEHDRGVFEQLVVVFVRAVFEPSGVALNDHDPRHAPGHPSPLPRARARGAARLRRAGVRRSAQRRSARSLGRHPTESAQASRSRTIATSL